MKAFFLILIVLISFLGVYLFIPPTFLLSLFFMVTLLPVIFIFTKRNLFKALLLWFIAVLFVELLMIPLPILPDIKLERIIWVSIFLTLLVETVFRQRRLKTNDIKIEIAMIIFCLYVVASMIISGTFYKEGVGLTLSTLLSGYVLPFSIFFFAKNIVDNESKIKKVFIFFTIIGFYLGITGIFEHFGLKLLVFPRYIMNEYFGVHFGRARGPFLNASTNGTVIGIIIFMAIYSISRESRKWIKVSLIIAVIVMLTGLFFTYTRVSWLGFLLALFVFPVFYPRIRIPFLIGVIASSIFIGNYLSSVQWSTEGEALHEKVTAKEQAIARLSNINPVYGRINLYAAMWRMFLEKPVFGFGFNTFKNLGPQYFYTIEGIPYSGDVASSHDTLGGILVELGLVGLSLIVFILFGIIKSCIRLNRYFFKDDTFQSQRLLPVVFFGITIIFLLNIQLIEMRYYMFPNSLFFLLAGIISQLNSRESIKLEQPITIL